MRLISSAILLSVCSAANAAVVWNENVDGDFSNSGATPDLVVLSLGDNVISGSVDAFGVYGADHNDFFTFSLAAGQAVTAIEVLSLGNAASGFIGIDKGSAYVNYPNSQSWGWTFFQAADVSNNILPRMGASNGKFVDNLTAGDYSIWLDAGVQYDYSINVVVSNVVPIPAAVWLFGSALAGLGWLRRKQTV